MGLQTIPVVLLTCSVVSKVFPFVAGSELGGFGRTASKQQLHRGAAGRHVLGSGASEELQGLYALQHCPE